MQDFAVCYVVNVIAARRTLKRSGTRATPMQSSYGSSLSSEPRAAVAAVGSVVMTHIAVLIQSDANSIKVIPPPAMQSEDIS